MPAVQEQQVPIHQVFLNFRGAELRHGFISYLENALRIAGINVFIDNDEMRGEDLTILFRRIKESKIALVVFSRRYMESKWCLNELVTIKECVNEEKLVAIPIFFRVKPAELKELFDEACHEFHGNVHETLTKKWKMALMCIKSKTGLPLEENSNEANFVKEIVDIVMQRLSTIPCLEGEEPEMANPVGIEHRLKQVEERLGFDRCDETRIVGIVGMLGIGKTTLATELFKRYRHKFNRCVYLKIGDLRLEYDRDANPLRKKFLEDLIPNTSLDITDVTAYDDYLKTKLRLNKVFVVLDDVSSARHVEILLRDRNWIKKGSRIVITSRDRELITEFDPNPYVVPRLSPGDGLMYFSFHAFEDCVPEVGDYMKMSRGFVDYARGNPSALRVLAQDLRGKGEDQWKVRLEKWGKVPYKGIQDLLKRSYDELSETEKDAFLDIACFFRSEDEYYARSLLDLGDLQSSEAASEITDLAYKFLISISGGRVEMHDSLHTFAMGLCSLAVDASNPEKCRLWNLRGCTSLWHLPKMNLSSLKTLILSGCSNLHKFQLISENLESLYLDGTAIEDLPADIVKLQRLILLNLKECRRLGTLPECIGKLKSLQELILSGCSNLKSFPNVEENMENFRVLLLDGTSIGEVPKILPGINSVLFLRRLSLSRNDVISSLGSDISLLYHLEWLDLKYCKKLRSLSTLPSNLQCLDAHGCISLETVASPLAFITPTKEIHTMFIFTNCCKLNEAAKNDIASHIRRKCQMISDDHHNGSFVSRALIGTCYPGYEVPPWFSHQAYGSVLEPNLPPHWCDNKFLGIALCAIVSFRDYRDQNNRLLAKCTCEFETLDAPCNQFSVPVEGWFETGNEPRTIESDHVFIGYLSWLNIKKRVEEEFKKGCVPTKAILRFQVTDGTGEEIAQCEVVKCGFGLVYEHDDEASDVVLSWARTRMNGEVSTYTSGEDDCDYPVVTPTTAKSENSFDIGSVQSQSSSSDM